MLGHCPVLNFEYTSQSTSPFTYPPTLATLGNPAGLQAHLTGPISRGNLFDEHVVAHSAYTAFDPPTVPGFYPPTFFPAAISSVTTSSHPHLFSPSPSTAIHSQYNASNDPWLGKRGMSPTDPECEPDRKRARQSLPEETRNTSQQNELHPSQYLVNTSSLIPSFNETPHAPAAPSTVVQYDDVSEQETKADWSIRYNNEIPRALDVTLIRSWDAGTDIHCVKFSKDGKDLAVGFGENSATNIYDVRTGVKIWLVFPVYLFPDNVDQPFCQYPEKYRSTRFGHPSCLFPQWAVPCYRIKRFNPRRFSCLLHLDYTQLFLDLGNI